MWKTVSTLCLLSIILFSFACAKKRIELPDYEGVDVRDVFSARSDISSIETTFSVTFEKDGTEVKGEGVLNISKNGDMSMRAYSFGFLVFQITSEDGIVRSFPEMDRSRGTLLTYGLRDCFFWWDMEDFEIEEKTDHYFLDNSIRKLWMDRKTMLPSKQSVALSDGRELIMYYEQPEKSGEIWYPAKIRIELSKYAVILKIRKILFEPAV
jgi:hypothetical protein